MRTIQLQVDDSNLDTVLTVIRSLKEGMIKNFKVKDDDIFDKEFAETKTYFNKCLYDIENGNSKLLSEEQYKNEMNGFVKNLKSTYANN